MRFDSRKSIKKCVSAGALPRIRWASLQRSRRPTSWIWEGEREGRKRARKGKWRGKKARGKEGKVKPSRTKFLATALLLHMHSIGYYRLL